ncbi:MAG: thioredoxin family protein [Chitinophagales bacterium]|jgi:peroxiredoxin|nr:thioredoxin family protein [Bacteroidota bacterium]MBK7568519.1 thioredoxin family protein [Bacteroidota bacterium]MBP8915340.1 thioredoxin family protein [Chitinophagales bacterium]MBP9220557.1 thioredoxin family protein [Chitinophagales bacterium]MBP9794825.1 thioredoxin family protein [Chitinophagales bacterium]
MNILFSAILTLGLLNNDPATTPAPVGYAVGDVVNNFSLMNVDGKNVSLNDYIDKEGVIVVFTCNHCPYAKAYETRIMELDAKYAGLNYPVIAINPNDPIKEPDDSPENMKKRAEEKNYSFPYLFDATQQVAKDFGATRTPHVFLLQKVNGQFKVAYIGAIDDNTDDASKAENKFVEDAIASLKKGEQPVVSFTKAIGCTIKWK